MPENRYPACGSGRKTTKENKKERRQTAENGLPPLFFIAPADIRKEESIPGIYPESFLCQRIFRDFAVPVDGGIIIPLDYRNKFGRFR